MAKVLPYCDEAEFYDNDNGFVLVAEYRNGELLLVGENPPAWILELRDYLRDKYPPATTGTERIKGVMNPGSTFGRGVAFHDTLAVGGGDMAFHHPTKPLTGTARVP